MEAAYRNVLRLPRQYTPLPAIERAASRFWPLVDRPASMPHDRIDNRCWRLRNPPTDDNWVRINAGNYRYEIRRFAYLLQVDEIWPGLLARPTCRTRWCLRGDHLKLRRSRNLPTELLGTMTPEEVKQTHRLRLQSDRRPHRQLKTVDAIAEAYDVNTDWLMGQYELLRLQS